MQPVIARREQNLIAEPESGKASLPPQKKTQGKLLGFASHLLPHDTTKTTCPPAPLVSGEGPLIIVCSLMRSGTHLLLDAMFNNFPMLRRRPLFVDFDAYERGSFPVSAFASATGMVIKTHYPQTPLAAEYASTLRALAERAFVLRPMREESQVRRSLAKWGMLYTDEEFAALEQRFQNFWAPYSPSVMDFSILLNPEGVANAMMQVSTKSGLRLPWRPVMPARSRIGVYMDKILTRAFGCRVRRVNTTIGYRLRPRSSE